MTTRKQPNASLAKRGPKAGPAHKAWANKRQDRKSMIERKNRGADFLNKFFDVWTPEHA